METLQEREELGNLEIERKFIISPENLSELEVTHSQDIIQAYFNSPDDEYELRIRSIDGFKDQYFAGIKSSGDLSRGEIEVPISAKSFVSLIEAIPGEHVQKNRFFTKEGFVVDVFGNQLDGLVVAEVEFASEDTANQFIAPSWFGQEVTNYPEYKNRNLIRSGVEKPKPNPEILDEIVRSLYGWRRTGRPVIIGVAGATASGKTTFARQLSEAVGAVPIISTDDYNRGKERLEAMYGGREWDDWDSPFVYDTELVAKDIAKLRQGQEIQKPIYDFKTSEMDKFEVVKPRSIIIVEGLFALDGNLEPLVDVGIYVDTHITDRLVRKLRRDPERLGWTPEHIFSYFMDRAEPASIEFVEPQKAKAQFVVNT